MLSVFSLTGAQLLNAHPSSGVVIIIPRALLRCALVVVNSIENIAGSWDMKPQRVYL